MKKIILTKMEIIEFEILRDQLNDYISWKNATLSATDFANYVNNLLLIDVAQKMFYGFRSKIEKATNATANMKLNISEAIILLDCCTTVFMHKGEFERFTMEKIKNILHKQIINL